jgi:hypothetical protein
VANSPDDPNAGTRMDALLQAFVEMGVPAFIWEIYNNNAPFGLIGPDFRHFGAWFALRRALGGHNEAAVIQDPSLTNVPESMAQGQKSHLKVSFTNTGQPWYQSVGYELELMGPGGTNLGEQAWLPADVPGSGRVTFEFDFTAPMQPGSYQFQMVQHGIELFGDAISFDVR